PAAARTVAAARARASIGSRSVAVGLTQYRALRPRVASTTVDFSQTSRAAVSTYSARSAPSTLGSRSKARGRSPDRTNIFNTCVPTFPLGVTTPMTMNNLRYSGRHLLRHVLLRYLEMWPESGRVS